MIQEAANKYKYRFNNVLVADTRLLLPMDSSASGSRQPDVLVLNSRLNKCQAHQQHQINSCNSCCLHIEQPEFRRRSSFSDPDPDCFADCSKRRSVNVELNAEAQLSGKLVILALSRINQLILDDESSDTGGGGGGGGQFKCQTKSTWLFQRFDPFKTGGQQTNEDPKLAYYSRFHPNQVASLLIDTMDFSWNKAINKELISLTIKSNLNNSNNYNHNRSSNNYYHARRRSQQVVMNETLLISEMDCFKSTTSGNNSTTGMFDDGLQSDDLGSQLQSSTYQPISKVHLLTLINRQSSTTGAAAERGPQDNNDNNNNGSRMPPNKMQTRVALANVETRKSAGLGPESSFNNGQNHLGLATTRSISSSSSSSSIGPPPPPPKLQHQTRARYTSSSTNAYYSYNKLPTSTTTSTSTTKRPYTDSTAIDKSDNLLQMNVPLLHKKYEFKINDSPRMGPAYLNESDLIRAKLSSKGFLVLTISSGLVILTYTLCLLVYLRWRHRIRARSRGDTTAGQESDPELSTSKASKDAIVPIQRVELDISQPYNLQMPPATRTRLKMMLRGGIVGGGGMKPEVVDGAVDPAAVAELRRAERRRKQSRQLLVSGGGSGASGNGGNLHLLNQMTSGGDKISLARNMNHEIIRAVGQGYSSRYKSQRQLNFGSINVVRAIRNAATLARSRLHLHSRYRPNLNVIPESDLECLQSPAASTATTRGNTYRGLFDQNNLVYISPPRSSSRPEDQFDSLVQDAMRTDCSHYVDRLTSQRQANATLFSKPIPDELMTKNTSPAVSRSKILRKVRQEDVMVEASERFENLEKKTRG